MQNNQQSGSQQAGVQQKQQYPSWAQPQKQQGNNKPAQPSLPAAKSSGMNASTKLALAFILGLILGWLVTWSWFDLRAPKTTGGSATNANSSATTAGTQGSGANALTITGTGATPTSVSTGSSKTVSSASAGTAVAGMGAGVKTNDTISVPSPQQAGTTVTVSNLSASTPVWAVVYEDNNGTVGRALGAHLVPKGQTSTTVTLLRTTLPNLSYYVGLVADTSSHTFSLHVNQPILGADGKQVMASFTAE